MLAINVYAATTGINTELNESAIVRLSGAMAMGKNTDRLVTRDAVETVLSAYNLGSSVVTVTDDTTNDYIVVTYAATSNQYLIDKNTIYTITYDPNGGTGAPAAQEKKHKQSITLSTTTPTRTNYRFRGWSTSSTATSATYQPGATYTTNGDVTLYAVWQAMYTVSYDANEGTGAPASQIKYHDETLTLQTGTPTRDNYRFKGWSTSSSATEATYQPGGSFTTNANTTLYAVWQAIYTITYNANEGSGAPLAQTKYHGESITLSTTTPTRSNYRFKGWSTSSSATTATYAAGATYSEEGNKTLYAVWQAMYTITYNANGGSNPPAAQTKYHGETLTLSSDEPDRDNYTFLGWSTSSTATTQEYNKGGSFTANANTTLYAVWQANTITITFNDNGGSGGPGTQTMYYNVATNLSTTTPTRSGYNFQGWGTSSTTSTVSYAAGASYKGTSNATLYAVWKLKTYTVTYNANGGSGAPSSQTKTYGTALTLSSTKPTRSGYVFAGWGTSSSATTVSYSAGGSYTSEASVTLYALWTQNGSYSYTGSIQTFKAIIAGTYQLKVYGAQGGNYSSAAGGKGGYAYGNVKLSAGTTLYIAVGGQNKSYNGGYEFSHVRQERGGAGGGGATHIAKATGELSALSSNKSAILIVAGGGGGAGYIGNWWDGNTYYLAGGTGGGASGGEGALATALVGTVGMQTGKGGTQSAAGSMANYSAVPAVRVSAFGLGGVPSLDDYDCYCGGGGGGGYYGGGAGYQGASGGGGSGYVGGCISGTTGNTAGQRSGNGTASITFVSP